MGNEEGNAKNSPQNLKPQQQQTSNEPQQQKPAPKQLQQTPQKPSKPPLKEQIEDERQLEIIQVQHLSNNPFKPKQQGGKRDAEPKSPPPAPPSSPKITGPKVEKQAPDFLQVIVVGLDNAGKSSIINRMKSDKVPPHTPPTAGFLIEKFQKGKTQLTIYDMAGATSYRNLWDEKLKGCQVLVFVVDSSDKFRMVVAREELETLLEQPDMIGVPVLVFANKNDLPTALNYSKVSEQLGLEEIADRSWNIVSSSALTGAGIWEGTEWVLGNYKKNAG